MERASGTGRYESLLERCRGLEPVPTAVAHRCEVTALAGAGEAGAKGLARADGAGLVLGARVPILTSRADSVRARIAGCAAAMLAAHARRGSLQGGA